MKAVHHCPPPNTHSARQRLHAESQVWAARWLPLARVWLRCVVGVRCPALRRCFSPRESSQHMTDEQCHSEDGKTGEDRGGGSGGGTSRCFVSGSREANGAEDLTAATKGLLMSFKRAISPVGVTWPAGAFLCLTGKTVEGWRERRRPSSVELVGSVVFC